MRFYTAHVRTGREPVLVAEGFSWGALLLGPAWLLSHRAWLPAVFVFVAEIAIGLLADGPLAVVLGVWLFWLTGLFGQDMRRWSLRYGGYGQAHVLAARDETAAFGRLLAVRPDLVGAGL